MTIAEFVNNRYKDIMLMSKKICKSHYEWEEVGHYSIEKFMLHERAEELIETNRAMHFLSGIIHRSFHSSTSSYHSEIRQRGRVHGFNSDEHLEFPDINYNIDEDNMIHKTSASVRLILEEMLVDHKDNWFRATLFQMWVENPNYSDLYRRTGIPRTTISKAVEEARQYIRIELKKRNIDNEY